MSSHFDQTSLFNIKDLLYGGGGGGGGVGGGNIIILRG